jgi:hypothetical protein
MDKDGLSRTQVVLGQILETLAMHSQDMVRDTRIKDMTGMDEAIHGVHDAM